MSLHSATNKEPTDCVTFLNTFSLKGFLPEVEHSNLLLAGGEGGGYFLQPLLRDL